MIAPEPFTLPPDIPIPIRTVSALLDIPVRRLQDFAYRGVIPIANPDRKANAPYEFFPRDFERIRRRCQRSESRSSRLGERITAIEREQERNRRELDFWREKLAPLLEA